jgi:heat shock protein HslJ
VIVLARRVARTDLGAMQSRRALLLAALATPALSLPAATEDRMPPAHIDPARIDPGPWRLVALDGAPFPARATLTQPGPGRIAGAAPCNRYTGPLRAGPPGFAAGPLAVTRMYCEGVMEAEAAFLATLEAMTAAEVAGDSLRLTGPEGRSLTFQRDPAAG